MHFEGEIPFSPQPALVWAKLSDAHFLVESIPDSEDPRGERESATCTVRPGFAFMRGKLHLEDWISAKLKLSERITLAGVTGLESAQ